MIKKQERPNSDRSAIFLIKYFYLDISDSTARRARVRKA